MRLALPLALLALAACAGGPSPPVAAAGTAAGEPGGLADAAPAGDPAPSASAPTVAPPTNAPADAPTACGRARAELEGRPCALSGPAQCKVQGAACTCASAPPPCQGMRRTPDVAPTLGTWRCVAWDGGPVPALPIASGPACTRP